MCMNIPSCVCVGVCVCVCLCVQLMLHFIKECNKVSITSAYCSVLACATATVDNDHKNGGSHGGKQRCLLSY